MNASQTTADVHGQARPADFFQAGRTYRSNDGLHTFTCRAVTPHPDPRIGENWAIGWHYADGTWLITELAPEWWNRGWTDITDHPPEPER